MGRPSLPQIARAVLGRYPATYGEELGVRSAATPSGSFRLLTMALLMGARIRADVALAAARALGAQRWTTPKTMAASTWAQRARTLNRAGYARYDERTSTMLGDTARAVVEDYRGDLRRLRETAERDVKTARRLGLGDDVRSLVRLADGDEFVRLVSGLVRTDLGRSYDEVISAAPG